MISVVGSLNMDLVINADRIPKPGETVLGSGFKKIPGGKGGNQAAAAARLDSEVTMIGAVGKDDLGDELIHSLKKNNVQTEYILKKDVVPTGIASIIVERSGNNAITVVPGANFALTEDDAEHCCLMIKQSKVLLVQLEIPLPTVRKALRCAKNTKCLTILNPAPAMSLDAEILADVDILTPNEIELAHLSGGRTNTMEEILSAGNQLLSRGVKQLIVTLGDKGCVCINQNGIIHYPARNVKAVDTTAAGDCFNGALAVALAEGKTIEEAILFAVSASALSVTKFGAQPSLPSRKEVEAFISNSF